MGEPIGTALIAGGVCYRCSYPFETATWVNVGSERICHDCVKPGELLRPGVMVECEFVIGQRPIGRMDEKKP